MICERCSTPMMPIFSPQGGWFYACIKCGTNRGGEPTAGRKRAGRFAERGLNCFTLQDYSEAQKNFARAARDSGGQPSYLWAMLLAEYGIRYCETRDPHYTITFWKRDLPARPLTARPEYRKLCRGAASELDALRYYQREAAEIDRGVRQVHELKREPYDVFLCFKDLNEQGITPERKLCDGLYQELRERSLNVFYAPRTLYGKYASDYEGYIHNALRDAKLLLVAASSSENAGSPWVENEWKRFQNWHQDDGRRLMTCVVGDMNPVDFPKELRRYQCELYAKEDRLSDRQTLEAIAARIERGCRSEEPRKRNWKAAAAAVAAVAVLAAGGALAWRFLPRSNDSGPAPEDSPIIEEAATEAPGGTEVAATEIPATKVPATEAPAAVSNSAWPTMRADLIVDDPPTVFGSKYARSSISSVRFENSLAGAPEDAWDVSEVWDGSVLAWVTPNGEMYDLTIAGEGGVRAPKRCEELFEGYTNAKSFHFDGNFDTSNATSMNEMFNNCTALTELDLSSLDTSNATSMNEMFNNCKALTELDLSGFDTSNVTDMRQMFNNCTALTELDLSSFDTSNVTDMGWMFEGCSSLTHLDLSSFDTSNVTDMSWMFFDCPYLTYLDLSNFDTSNVTDMSYMFRRCNRLTAVRSSPRFVINDDTDTYAMLDDCPLAKSDLLAGSAGNS